MKTKLLGSMLLLASSMMMAPNVGALSVYDPDTFLFSDDIGSGDQAEQQALADWLGVGYDDLTLVSKIDTNFPALVAFPDGLDQWYVDVAPLEPGYFMLKFGVGSLGVDDHYYFANDGLELNKLVWTNEDVNYLTALGVGRLSHYALFDADEGGGGGGGGETPEPATTALMGIGFLSLAMSYARRVTS